MTNEPTSWHSYPSIFTLGHKAVSELFLDPVLIEEKVDGSQFSFGRFGAEGTFRARSKGKEIDIDRPEKMFVKAIKTAQEAPLRLDCTYRAEYLEKPKHNVLAYERVPKGNLMIFDINTGHEEYMGPEEKAAEAARIGLECVPVVHQGMVESIADFSKIIDRMSVLGGQKVEGVVVKNYSRFGIDKRILIGKYVSESFKEVHAGEWRKSNPTGSDILTALTLKYRTPARWAKAVQHLKERGEIEGSPKDIGKIMQEVQDDILKECREEIAEAAFKWAWEKTRRTFSAGVPEWYKGEMLKDQFEKHLKDCSAPL